MRITEMLGKPIVSVDSGEKAGHVEEMLLGADHRHVVGVLVSNGPLSHQRVLPFAEVQTAGDDAALVRTVSTICDASAWLAEGRPAHRSSELRGKAVVTSAGARVGHVYDVVAEQGTGKVTALELGQRRRGTRPALVQVLDGVDLTHDVIVVPATEVVPQNKPRRAATRLNGPTRPAKEPLR